MLTAILVGGLVLVVASAVAGLIIWKKYGKQIEAAAAPVIKDVEGAIQSIKDAAK